MSSRGETPTAGDGPPTGPYIAKESDGAHETAADWPVIPGYEILESLPPGGMGVVYRARQLGLKRIVALKMMRSGVHAAPDESARFRIEAEAVASLSHPHIIPIHEFGIWQGLPYLTMEFAEGGSLARRLESGPLSPSAAVELVETLARAVQFVHDRGIVHRDLKPANILLTAEEMPKLADFGLAKRLEEDQGLTGSRAVLGTASYMAPEQAAGSSHAVGPSADIYALGAILYEVLAGRPPFLAATRELTIHQVLFEEPLPLRRRRAEVPAELEAICLVCLEKEPERRYPTALALAEDLGRFRQGQPLSIVSPSILDWHRRWALRAGYEILETLGAAAEITAYKARQLSLNRTVVLEVVTSSEHQSHDQINLARKEAEAIAQLHHPNFVEIYDFGEFEGSPFLAREYVEGTSLAARLAGPIQPVEQTALILETLGRALHQAHLHDLVHGSLKPAKVLLTSEGGCKITGLGSSRLLCANSAGVAGAAPAAYLAPEQQESSVAPIGPAADIYALGAMLQELVTGRVSLEKEPVRPSELGAICLKCLEREPAVRYPSAAALAEDLRRFRNGEVLFIDDLDDWPQQQRWARRAGYEIAEILEQGRDGFTYKARQGAHSRNLVLRRITAQDRFLPAAKDRFVYEARILSRFRHANIAQLYDQGEQNDLSYFAREFVDGPSLMELAATRTLLKSADEQAEIVREAAELVEILARAIHELHTKGVFHGGLYPGNVRLTSTGVPKITSFRRVRPLSLDPADGPLQPEMLMRAGYFAPEQLERGRHRLTPAVDIYALGAILYTLLTGKPPFLAQSFEETLTQVRCLPPAPPAQPALPSKLQAVCFRCLEKQPARRPGTALALAEELAGAVD
jgi:serine/threonine protein kinase